MASSCIAAMTGAACGTLLGLPTWTHGRRGGLGELEGKREGDGEEEEEKEREKQVRVT